MTYVRRTSLEIYRKIKAEGLLSKRRYEVYSWLYHNGPATANEVFKGIHGTSSIQNANISPRLNEMVQIGAVAEVRERPCKVTGNTTIEYDVTQNVPKPYKRTRKTKAELAYEQGYKDGYNDAMEVEKQ